MVFSAQAMPMAAHATKDYVMPSLNNNFTVTEEQCFLCSNELSFEEQSDNCRGLVVVSCYCEELVVQPENSSGTQRKKNVCLWKPLPSNG
jgi:hypothetical protein